MRIIIRSRDGEPVEQRIELRTVADHSAHSLLVLLDVSAPEVRTARRGHDLARENLQCPVHHDQA